MPDVQAKIRLLEERINLYARLLGRAASPEREHEFACKIAELEEELTRMSGSMGSASGGDTHHRSARSEQTMVLKTG